MGVGPVGDICIDGTPRSLDEVDEATLDGWLRACRAALPSTPTYDVILADCPWRYDSRGYGEGAVSQRYPTMSVDDLKALPVGALASKTSVLFLWATGPKLPEALEVMRAWGFTFKTVFKTWIKTYANGKPTLGIGHWSRGCTELLLVGTRGGGYMKWRTKRDEPQFHSAPLGRHSAKPPEIRDMIRDYMDVPNRIELFARSRAEGWDAWGLEIPGFIARGRLKTPEEPRAA